MGNPIVRSHVVWRGAESGGLLFDAGAGDRVHLIDGSSRIAPSPVETLLGSVATCAASDVVDILTKQRTPPRRLEVDVFATRRADFPRRVMTLELTFIVDGAELDGAKVDRAIALSIEKYCSVAATLAGDIELTTVLVLNGGRSDPVRRPMFSANFPPRG